jgi:hypothetical protein
MKAYVITTCTRSYLTRTIDSLKDAGFDVELVVDENRIGPFRAFKMALAKIREPRCLIAQDDILISKHCCEYLESQALPDGLISLYTATPLETQGRGWFRLPGQEKRYLRVFGACAQIWTAELAHQFLVDDLDRGSLTRADIIVGKWCVKRELPYWCHMPSLCQHIGALSTLGEHPLNENRVADSFIEDCECLLQRSS